MKISFEGIGELTATFLAEENSGVKPGDVVCMTGNGQVGLGTAGMAPCGVAYNVSKDGFVGVQIGGMAEVAYSGTDPTVGWNMLTTDGNGGMAVVNAAVAPASINEGGDSKENQSANAATPNGVNFLVVSVDTDANTAVVKL